MIGTLYKNLGLIESDEVLEVSRPELVAEYVGQTAIKTQEVLERAKGKVLFIDEAYTLSEGNDTFGQEAIDTILKFMEDNRDNTMIIVAGYQEPMEKFLKSNIGLASRFNKKFIFDNYTTEELMEILKRICEKNNYKIDETNLQKLKKDIDKIDKNQSDFSNARYIRNLYENAIVNQATRIMNDTNANLEELIYDDFIDLKN